MKKHSWQDYPKFFAYRIKQRFMPNSTAKELSFFEHLDELRYHIVRSLVYFCLGSGAGWYYRELLLEILRRPAEIAAKSVGIEQLQFRVFEPMGGFLIALQVSLVAGIILAAPLILFEIWRFIEPALEKHERKYVVVVLPAAVFLFLGGVVFCYYVSPAAFKFFFMMDQSLGVDIERTLKPYLTFLMRLMLGFGLSFEMPLVLMFLGVIGLVNARLLLDWWRQAVVLIFVIAALVTPTVDPVNMTLLAAPLTLLYLLSIGLVALVQRKKTEPEFEEETEYIADEAPETETDIVATEKIDEAEITAVKEDFDISQAPVDPSWETYQATREIAETDVGEEEPPDDSDEPEIYRR